MKTNNTYYLYKQGLLGFVIGDTLGVPVEFMKRSFLKQAPVVTITAGGRHNQPLGTWSDDTSLTLCTIESLKGGLNLNDLADKFILWMNTGYMTPYGKSFGIGQTTINALFNYKRTGIIQGMSSENDNGNGSLMRMLPVVFFVKDIELTQRHEIVHQISSITHAHPISLMSCSIYIEFMLNLLEGKTPNDAYTDTITTTQLLFANHDYSKYLQKFERILANNLIKLTEDEIDSSGFVISTLEASLWSFLTTTTYEDAVLKAVNLGKDADTIGAITGSMAGLYYNVDSEQASNWLKQIVDIEKIVKLIPESI